MPTTATAHGKTTAPVVSESSGSFGQGCAKSAGRLTLVDGIVDDAQAV